MTASPLTMTRDPFETSMIDAANLKPADRATIKLPSIAPTTAGLMLTSTIIGPQRRIAQISGKTYAVGQTIEPPKGNETLGAVFTLIEVQSRRVVLEAAGQRFELLIPEPGKSNKIEILKTVGSG